MHRAQRATKRKLRLLAGHAGLCSPCAAPALPAGPAPLFRPRRGGPGGGAAERGARGGRRWAGRSVGRQRRRQRREPGGGRGHSEGSGQPVCEGRAVEPRRCRPAPGEGGPRRLRAAVAAPAHSCGGGRGRRRRGVRSRSGGTASAEPAAPRGGASPRLQVFPRPAPAAQRSDREGSPGLAGAAGSGPPLELGKAAIPERGPSAAGPGRALPQRCRPGWFGSPRFQNRQVTVRSSAPSCAGFGSKVPAVVYSSVRDPLGQELLLCVW